MRRKAAETLEGPVLILAGAGSGKTRTLTYRIANLIDHGVKPWHILALTFTNKAAREMRGRVEKLIGSDVEDMWIGTFHSVCVRILRRDIEKIGYQRSFTIYDEDDQLRVIKDCVKTLGMDETRMSQKEIRAKINDAKNKMLTPDEALEYIGHPVGGVCPFGIKDGVDVYLDESLKRFETVFPAVGSASSAIELNLDELYETSKALEWIDVCKLPE